MNSKNIMNIAGIFNGSVPMNINFEEYYWDEQ